MKEVVAIIPARGGSKGIPRKNLKLIGGQPLVGHAINQALSCRGIHRTIVSTEDSEIRQVAMSFGAEVMDRPEKFAHDNTIQEVDRLLCYTVDRLEQTGEQIDVVVLLYATAPLRDAETIDRAVHLVTHEGYDSALSVYEDTSYIWRKNGHDTLEPVNYDPAKRGPRQKEAWNQYVENKAVYVMNRHLLMNTGCRLGGRIGFVTMPRWRSIDVDQPEDLRVCRLLHENLERRQPNPPDRDPSLSPQDDLPDRTVLATKWRDV